ncbi:hypothetical protein HY948_00370 [Candidatus Gottesmanbacteria bacterium]|nr:hypothetical protein [Candidatus Gottesmanbacteria bacterium]
MLFSLFSLFFLFPFAVAQASSEATPSTNQKQLNDLKDRLATKVAELRQLQRKAISGTVKTVSASTATIETATKDIKIELLDDIAIAQVIKGTRTKLTIDKLEKGDQVVVFGEFDATLDLLRAKAIFIESALPQRIAGTVVETKKTDYTITVKTPEGKQYTVDIETITKISAWTSDKGMTKAGFSKLTSGDSVHVIGTPVAKKEDRLSALRILDLGNLTGRPIPTEQVTQKSATTPSQ